MLKKRWKSFWLFASLLSLVFLLQSGSNAMQDLERKACDSCISANQPETHVLILNKLSAALPKIIGHALLLLSPPTNAVLIYTNQVVNALTQPKIYRLNSASIQPYAFNQNAQTNFNANLNLPYIVSWTFIANY